MRGVRGNFAIIGLSPAPHSRHHLRRHIRHLGCRLYRAANISFAATAAAASIAASITVSPARPQRLPPLCATLIVCKCGACPSQSGPGCGILAGDRAWLAPVQVSAQSAACSVRCCVCTCPGQGDGSRPKCQNSAFRT